MSRNVEYYGITKCEFCGCGKEKTLSRFCGDICRRDYLRLNRKPKPKTHKIVKRSRAERRKETEELLQKILSNKRFVYGNS